MTVQRTRSQGEAVGAERQAVNTFGVALKLGEFPAVGRVPESDGVIVTGRGEEAAVGAIGHGADSLGMAFQDRLCLPGMDIPKAQLLVPCLHWRVSFRRETRRSR